VSFVVPGTHPRVRALLALAPASSITGAGASSSSYPSREFPLLNRTMLAPEAGSSVLVLFDGETNAGAVAADGSPESHPLFVADSMNWLRFRGADGGELPLLGPPFLNWTSAWLQNNSALLVTFLPGSLAPVFNATTGGLVAPAAGVVAPAIGLTRVAFTGGVSCAWRRARGDALRPTPGGRVPRLGP
jgi:hypothetical protein